MLAANHGCNASIYSSSAAIRSSTPHLPLPEHRSCLAPCSDRRDRRYHKLSGCDPRSLHGVNGGAFRREDEPGNPLGSCFINDESDSGLCRNDKVMHGTARPQDRGYLDAEHLDQHPEQFALMAINVSDPVQLHLLQVVLGGPSFSQALQRTVVLCLLCAQSLQDLGGVQRRLFGVVIPRGAAIQCRRWVVRTAVVRPHMQSPQLRGSHVGADAPWGWPSCNA
mmetsp:Transcript_7704/g.18153  ORF Transcript_7704/g.18153 Transcript_7704/m.18153 type:complete len:223 (-) Transcript_7704:335-1003(-)